MLTDGGTDGRTHGRTDGRTDDGRKVITIAHPEQSSGELKKALAKICAQSTVLLLSRLSLPIKSVCGLSVQLDMTLTVLTGPQNSKSNKKDVDC